MSERFTKLLSLPPDLYAEGSPLIVSAGNLLKDNQTGQVLVQLKIKNISPKTVKAATVAIRALDTMGRPIEGDAAKEYLDLFVRQGEEFGQKAAIPLPNPSTRGFTVTVKEVVFADNSAYEGTDAPWEPLPAATPLTRTLEDLELVKQYELTFGGPCQVAPQEHKNLWQCACGAWNREGTCYACRKGKSALFSLDLESLKADKNARLVREKAEREAHAVAEKAAAEQAAAEAAAKAKKAKKLLAVLIPAAAVGLAAILLITQVLIPNSNYKKAMALLDAGQYEEAIAAFEALDGYKDSAAQIKAAKEAIAEQERLGREAKAEQERLEREAKAEQERVEQEATNKALYEEAERLLNSGDVYGAALAFYRISEYKDSWMRCFALWGDLTCRETISAGGYHSVAVHNDGTAIAIGSNLYGQCDVEGWTDIAAVSGGGLHTLGLKTDGTVVAVGLNENGECNVEKWCDIVAVAAGLHFSIGLRADGTVVSAGSNDQGQCSVSNWKNIIAIAAGRGFTIGLLSDGTVVGTGRNEWGQCSLSGWKNIKAIAASGSQKIGGVHSVGLLADGSVVAKGYEKEGECNVSEWKDIAAISAGSFITIGIRKDGTVAVAGSNYTGIVSGVADWKDIVAVSAADYPSNGGGHALALTSSGRVLAVGDNRGGQCDVSDWTNIRVPER